MKKQNLLLASLLALTACASPPSPAQLADADYGPYPTNWKALVKERLESVLVDPGSAEYRFNYPAPIQGWQNVKGPAGGFSSETIYGWKACFQYNAKNRMGGYGGYEDVYVFFKNGRIALFDTKYGGVACKDL